MKNVVLILLALCTMLPLVSCGGRNDGGSYEQITPAEAKALMDSGKIILYLTCEPRKNLQQGI